MWDPRDPFVYSWGKVAAETKNPINNERLPKPGCENQNGDG